MNEPQPPSSDPGGQARAPEPESSPAATQSSAEPRSYAPLFMKGCGWSLLSIMLAVGVLVAGKGDFESVGSALAGVVILLLVLSSSGLTGFWK